jgi:hypothetical protein
MSLRINPEAPNFTAQITQGTIDFHHLKDGAPTIRVIGFGAAAHDVATPILGHESREIVMSTLQRISIGAVTAMMLGTVGVSAEELPKYEVAGFPISRIQIAVLGSDRIQEQSPTPTLTLNGMPDSPHQISLLYRQPKRLPNG